MSTKIILAIGLVLALVFSTVAPSVATGNADGVRGQAEKRLSDQRAQMVRNWAP